MYRELSTAVAEKILRAREEEEQRHPLAFPNREAHRRDPEHDKPSAIRPPFVRDAEKILHSAYYNRYADKTQVFSLYRNDDLSRRALHVQLVSRIARTLGQSLGLNLDLIEAIALGHDIGHTPFGHAGERYLSSVLEEKTGRIFQHNVHSVRVLDRIFHYNLTLETLSGIVSHNGEVEAQEYTPEPLLDFSVFDRKVDACYRDAACNLAWVPSTLEGCIVRISDIIAYLGKDRQDAKKIGLLSSEDIFADAGIGTFNAEIIHNIEVDLIEHSYEKPYLSMSEEVFRALSLAKQENYRLIYHSDRVQRTMDEEIFPRMERLFDRLYRDLVSDRKNSVIFRHHLSFVEADYSNRNRPVPYREEDPYDIVVDYIASMTDDYFLDLYDYLFPGSASISFRGYFQNAKNAEA